MGTRPLVQLLSTNGDGSGVTNAVGDYSSVAETFEIDSGSNTIVVARLVGYIRDTGQFAAEGYGAGAELTNGVSVAVFNSSDVKQFDLTPAPIKNNGEWSGLCYDTQVQSWGIGDEFLSFRWSFEKFADDGGLVLDQGDKLVVTLNDSFVVLLAQTFMANGTITEDY